MSWVPVPPASEFPLENLPFGVVAFPDGRVRVVVRIGDFVFDFARAVQAFENQPLGPLLSRSLATTISPWVVTLEALAPFIIEAQRLDPPPDPYLRARQDWDPDLSVKKVDLNGTRLTRTNLSSIRSLREDRRVQSSGESGPGTKHTISRGVSQPFRRVALS